MVFFQFVLKTGVDGFFQFDLKTSGRFFSWALKPRWWMVFRFGPQNRQPWFGDLGLKITATVSWFGSQNQAGFGLSIAYKTDGGRSARDTHWDLAACLAWKQVWLGFPSLVWRLVEARQRVVHVAPSRRLRRRQAEDGRVNAMGYVRPCYRTFTVFNVLCTRGIVVI
jgi:hypothetical protein